MGGKNVGLRRTKFVQYPNSLHLTTNYCQMRALLKVSASLLLLTGTVVLMGFRSPKKTPPPTPPKIQAAILLDVSGSMQGLIEQAKAQLWNMMNVMGRVHCTDGTPQIEVALYEYGRRTNNQADGFVRRVSSFTSDLDSLSKMLFGLTIDGSEEYCTQAIYQSLKGLSWDTSKASYKVIFIAGNEDFMQGTLPYEQACKEAKQMGVIVNTIYCGPRNKGIDERWDLGNQCGNGAYTNINHNLKLEDDPTPFDTALITLNTQFNATYLPYGERGARAYAQQAEVDKLNFGVGRKVAAHRVLVKSQSRLYENSQWDLVDALDDDSTLLSRLDRSTLPDTLRGKTTTQLQTIVRAKKMQRGQIQQQIAQVQQQRDAYLVQERLKQASRTELATLETEIERIIRDQVKRYNMTVQ